MAGAERGPGQAELVAKPQPARAPKATIVRGEYASPVVKIERNYKELPGITRNYQELPEITRNYQKLPEAAVCLSGKNGPS